METSMRLFSMRHTELCEDFNKRVGHNLPHRTGQIIGTRPLTASTVSGELMGWILNNGLPYFNHMGRIWFTKDGKDWITTDYEVSNGIVTFYEMKA